MKHPLTALVALLICCCVVSSAQRRAPQRGEPELPGEAGMTVPASTGAVSGSSQDPFLGGVPSGIAQPEVLSLSLAEAVDRGLKYNLGLLLADQQTESARGAHWRALSDLLPNVTTATSVTRSQVDLAAFGISIPGFPTIVGPFNVFDARAFVSQSVFDLNAINKARARSEDLKAASLTYRDARDVVVVVCVDLYLQALAGASRIEAMQAQLTTAQSLYDRAVDLKKAGVVPSIDVLRSQVQLQAQKQRLIFFQNEFAKQKLNLARAIGLPVGQEFSMTDRIPYSPPPPITLEEALARAYRSRPDYQRAFVLLSAAESAKKAARGEGLPSLGVNADFGDIGARPGRSHETFTMAATLRIPVFQGGRVRGKVLEADALLRQRTSELGDMRGRIDYEVRRAFLDLKASGDQVQVAESALTLAREQVKQTQDRFAAGVTDSLEVVQGEEALATADENYISSLYNYNLAKGSLARALGEAEQSLRQLLGGTR